MSSRKIIEGEIDDRLDAALSDISTFDAFKQDHLARYIATAFAESSHDINDIDDWFNIWYEGRKGYASMTREELVEEIEGLEVTPLQVAKWIKDNISW